MSEDKNENEVRDSLRHPVGRRLALHRLLAMTFLTAGISKFSSDANARGKTAPTDPTCRQLLGPSPAYGYSKDEDCGTANDPIDEDCGLPTGQGLARHNDSVCTNLSPDDDCGKRSEDGSIHTDSDCSTSNSDFDCGLAVDPAHPADGGYSDSDCSVSQSDNDCGIVSQEDGSAYTDQDCSAAVQQSDQDCGRFNPEAGGHEDHDCHNFPGSDNDCGVFAGNSAHSDNDCNTVHFQGDQDCGLMSGGTVHSDDDGIGTNNPTEPSIPSDPTLPGVPSP